MSFEDHHVEALSDEELERRAFEHRLAIGSGHEWAPDILDLIKRAGSSSCPATRGLELVTLPDQEMGPKEAYAEFNPPRIVVRASVHAAAQEGEPRARMTLAHEYGHIVLHPGAPKARMQHGNETPKFIKPANSAERQARVFAGAFLMPAAFVRKCSSAEALKRLCNVSQSAARVRFEQFEKRTVGKRLPEDILRAIASLDADPQTSSRGEGDRRRIWSKAPPIDHEDPAEFRKSNRGFRVRWSDHKKVTTYGWEIENGEIVAYEDLRTR